MRAVSVSKADDNQNDRARAWSGEAPDALIWPALYEGIRVKRMVAYAIDLIIIAVLLTVMWMVGIFFVAISFGLLAPVLALATALFPIAYHTSLIGGPASATVGMRVMDLRVVAWNGNRPGYAQAALQTVLFYVSVTIATFLVLTVSLFNPRGRCLHDLLAGTVTINDLHLRAVENNPELP
ncbi:MAG: RDD family protein [Alphaproteobacteria bacterium]|nr:RDD family protein [Alphaproteobacteria bacterium]